MPFLSVFEEDAMAFWAFERHMQRVKKLFRHDETGVRREHPCCILAPPLPCHDMAGNDIRSCAMFFGS